ncbi:phosphotransferase [Streptomyces sp. RKAG293]|uniref:phosphotransferase n=1 Tax=Streptomyces sp. RKAG293 TaxID=2893403 RepID=UPI0020333541|nr:phosphotransferase [Streptomyces sp. RKAG293]MCM2420775.1 phosphotransferase [Streptomyces sp. RKAG293]
MEGPFPGYHNVTYAVRPDAVSRPGLGFHRLKLREPRPGVFWFDLRLFSSEDQLISALQGRIPHIPPVAFIDEHMSTTVFIEGRTLGSLRSTSGGRTVGAGFLDQIEKLFQHLVACDTARLPAERLRLCKCDGLPRAESSTGFLRRVVHFTLEHVYAPHRERFSGLLADLDVREDALSAFEGRLPELTPRPSRLLHGDLHCENFIVDNADALWTIDWELALIGDPLYDLATHLHLMRYPSAQRREMIARWKRAVGEEASRGADGDLPHYLDYKRVQSVITDVIRGATGLDAALDYAQLGQVTAVVVRALRAAQEPLGLDKVPSRVAVEAAFEAWHRRHAAPVTAGRGPSTWTGR